MKTGRAFLGQVKIKGNKVISFAKRHSVLGKVWWSAVCIGSFCSLKSCGCSVNECCMVISTVAMSLITYKGNQQNKAGIEAAKMQAEAAIQSLQEAQKQWKEEYRPRFAVYFVGGSKDVFWYLTIENIGKTSAYDIEASCDSFQNFPEYPRKRSYFPPGRKEILDKLYMNSDDHSITNQKKLHLKLRYTDCNKKPFEESVEVFFSNRWSL